MAENNCVQYCSQRQSQIRTMMEIIDCEEIIKDVRDYHKPWWVINAFHHEDLKKRLEVEGVSCIVAHVIVLNITCTNTHNYSENVAHESSHGHSCAGI